MLIIVRHARPRVDPAKPAAEWTLSEEGTAAASALGPLLRGHVVRPRVVSSPERKALETARTSFPGHTVISDERLAEAAKPWFDTAEELHRATAAYLAGEAAAGWEDAEAVAQRFDLCMSDPGQVGDVVAFTHGTALAVWLSRRRQLSDPFDWWRNLKAPDAWMVGPTADDLVRIGAPDSTGQSGRGGAGGTCP